MEITRGCVDKYSVAKLAIKPPIREDDIAEIEILFVSATAPGSIKGFMTVAKNGDYNPRSYGMDAKEFSVRLSSDASRRLRKNMKELAKHLIGELGDV